MRLGFQEGKNQVSQRERKLAGVGVVSICGGSRNTLYIVYHDTHHLKNSNPESF